MEALKESDQKPQQSASLPIELPPSPPDTTTNSSASNSEEGSDSSRTSCNGDEPESAKLPKYALPPACRTDITVLKEDLKTPDSHVERDARLIRLTGVHPFNVEAPLSDLYNEGFLTTKDLHYVRNHGPVPKVADEEIMDWEFTVEGMVEKPITLSLARLIEEYEQVTYPVTLVCAGNRRKEQNVVRKTKGFSWGAAGLSTALWTGVVIGEVLKRAVPRRGAKFVCFEGADKLPNGYYGTSVKLNWAMDPNRGIMLAHRMNGEMLHPDHGKPLRVIIPGQIGGRSVKWLKKIIVTSAPSDNWYHIYDNRVLPTMIDPEQSANLPETWKDERYAIYDLNTNSATCFPAHDERLALSNPPQSYNVRGYAYAGGGKRVTRVEISLDKGKTWSLAEISYPEDEYREAPDDEQLFGGRLDMSWRETCFCWCFWNLEIPIDALRQADDIMVRAMDESMMVQPRDMYWSVLGMMNNPWFRVVIHKEGHELRFEHPTLPALQPGGWMERVKKAGGNLTNGNWGERIGGEEEVVITEEVVKEICLVRNDVTRKIGLDELREHEGEAEPWFVVNGEVYDGTKFLEGHPGGAASIIGAAGQDATEEFLAIHSENAKAMMPDYHIGSLDAHAREVLAAGDDTTVVDDAQPRAVFLHPKTWSRALLTSKETLSPDTKLFHFRLEHAAQTVGLPVGQHLLLRLRDPVTREAIIRAYTPVSETHERGTLRVLIKLYPATAEYPDGGRMTQALDAIPPGHFVDFKGPTGKFEYIGGGRCTVSGGAPRRIRRFVMICAGSGVTPIFQVLRAVLTDPAFAVAGELDDSATGTATTCVVLDGNRAEEDILCRAELDALVDTARGGGGARCRLLHTLSRPGPDWTGLRGRIDAGLIEKEAGRGKARPADGGEEGEDMVLVCGPPALERSVKETLLALDWREEQMIFF